MEVLEYKYDNIETKIITCSWCGSRLQVVETDIKEYDNKDYEVHYRSGHIQCPVCHNENWINWRDEEN